MNQKDLGMRQGETSVTFPGEAAQADGEAHGNGEEGEEDEVDGVPLPEEHHGQQHCRVQTRVTTGHRNTRTIKH